MWIHSVIPTRYFPSSLVYPFGLDTLRVVIIPPSRQFNLNQCLGIEDLYYIFGFVFYLMFRFVAKILLYRERRAPSLILLGVTIIEESTGLGTPKKHRHLSVIIGRVFWTFFVFIIFITASARILALLTNTAIEKEYATLNSVRNSKIDIVVPTPGYEKYPNIFQLTEMRLRKPLIMDLWPINLRIAHGTEVFAIIVPDFMLRDVLDNLVMERRYYVIKETFGE